MKDLILPLFAVQIPLAMAESEYSFWDRMAERWGIGLVGLVLVFFLARWSADREAKASKARDDREAASNAERLALLSRNNELQEQQIAAQAKHAQKLEQLTKDGNKAQADNAEVIRNLIRKMKRPCVAPWESPDQSTE